MNEGLRDFAGEAGSSQQVEEAGVLRHSALSLTQRIRNTLPMCIWGLAEKPPSSVLTWGQSTFTALTWGVGE